jgi:hypothetical protein
VCLNSIIFAPVVAFDEADRSGLVVIADDKTGRALEKALDKFR